MILTFNKMFSIIKYKTVTLIKCMFFYHFIYDSPDNLKCIIFSLQGNDEAIDKHSDILY